MGAGGLFVYFAVFYLALIDGSVQDPALMSDAAHPFFDVDLCNITKTVV